MKTMSAFGIAILAMLVLATAPAMAQVPLPTGGVLVQPAISQYAVVPISSTAAINTQTTLTIPAPPPNQFNYVCYLSFSVVQDGTSTANVLAVTTSTNFNSFALKYSLAATADAVLTKEFNWGGPATGGCAKSTSSGTATTFVSPAGAANTTYTWYATYFQGL